MPGLGWLALALLGLLLVSTPEGLGLLLCLAVPIVVLFVVLGGRGRGAGLVAIAGLFLPRRSPPPDARHSSLLFRVEHAQGLTDVRLHGTDHGVMLGDRVEVRGVRTWGVVTATSVRNMTSGAVLHRRGLMRTYVLATLDLLLALMLVITWLTR